MNPQALNIFGSIARIAKSANKKQIAALSDRRANFEDVFLALSERFQRSALRGMWKEGLVMGGVLAAWEFFTCDSDDRSKVIKTAIFGGLASLVVGSIFVAFDQSKDLVDVARQMYDGPDPVKKLEPARLNQPAPRVSEYSLP